MSATLKGSGKRPSLPFGKRPCGAFARVFRTGDGRRWGRGAWPSTACHISLNTSADSSADRPNGIETDHDLHASRLGGRVDRHRPTRTGKRFSSARNGVPNWRPALCWLGPQAAALHDIPNVRCGIMDLIQLYEPADRQKVLLALEEAATIATTFSFATTIRSDASGSTGRSSVSADPTRKTASAAPSTPPSPSPATVSRCAATSRGPLN
jgi:hypothetical protein